MNRQLRFQNFGSLLGRRPQAWARILGSDAYPNVQGSVRFYQTTYGVLTVAELQGLPDVPGACEAPVFGFHIHEGVNCSGDEADPFADAGMHWNPNRCPHPYHAGDMPPLFGAGGYAYSAFLSDRFTVQDILGKTVIIHSQPDDFTTQPSGNSGRKIACGVITSVAR